MDVRVHSCISCYPPVYMAVPEVHAVGYVLKITLSIIVAHGIK